MNTFPYKLIDLTHTLDETTCSWSGGCGFKHEVKLDYSDCTDATKFRIQKITMHAGIGTHMDAPAHCIPGGKTIDELNISDLVAPCVVIDISDLANKNYSLSIQDIQRFEDRNIPLKEGVFVFIRTGWERFWNNPIKYRNEHVFPSVSGEAAEYLVSKGIAGLGVDTLSPDRPTDGYPVHSKVLGAGRYIVENVANLDKLPALGAFIMALPIKTRGGTEAPIRLVGLI